MSHNFNSLSFPPLITSDGSTAVTSISEAELFAQHFSKNSTLDDSRHVSPTYPSSDFTMSVIKILNNDVFYALSGLSPWKAYGPNGVPPIVLKN